VTSPEDDVVICLKPADWPVQDQLAWATATREDDLLDEPGLLTHLRPVSLLKLQGAYGRWLWHLTVTDPALLASPPAARITRDTVARYITELSARNASLTVAHRVLDLERAAKAFAPAGDWRWLRKLVNKLFVRARPVRDKRARMRPPRDVFDAGLALMLQAETSMFTSAKKRALAFRDGLLLALLASRAPRVGNVAMMDIQRHLERSGEVWILRFDGAEMKNGSPFEVPLPRELTAPLARYVQHWRGVLLEDHPRTSRVWISAFGRPLGDDEVHYIVTRRTRQLFGVSMHPHLLRAGLMTETAIRDPEHVGIASTLLSHRAPTTSSKPYNLARQHEAARQLQQHVQKLRRAARRDQKRFLL
jgi:integrase/recombinase XerD